MSMTVNFKNSTFKDYKGKIDLVSFNGKQFKTITFDVCFPDNKKDSVTIAEYALKEEIDKGEYEGLAKSIDEKIAYFACDSYMIYDVIEDIYDNDGLVMYEGEEVEFKVIVSTEYNRTITVKAKSQYDAVELARNKAQDELAGMEGLGGNWNWSEWVDLVGVE